MRRIILAILICLLPLQSFAGLVMNAKMAGMEVMMTSQTEAANISQAPCHEASQSMAADSQDCCGLQGVCQAMCQLAASLPEQAFSFSSMTHRSVQIAPSTQFVSATAHTPQKPPIS